MFNKYKNYLKLKIAVSEYNQTHNEKIDFKDTLKSINDLTDNLEVNGVIDALNGVY